MTCLLGCGSVWLLLNTNIIHVCKGQVTYFFTTAIMSKNSVPMIPEGGTEANIET